MKQWFHTSEIAKMLEVAHSTVNKWVQFGKLESSKTPGGDNRVFREDLVKFMKQYNMPLSLLDKTFKKRVLVVDDDKALLKIMKSFCKKKHDDCLLETAETGYQAGLLTEQFRPDVIVLDISLRDIDGRDVCKNIRKYPEFNDIQIIAISGVIDDKKSIKRAGFDSFLQKPFDLEELETLIFS